MLSATSLSNPAAAQSRNIRELANQEGTTEIRFPGHYEVHSASVLLVKSAGQVVQSRRILIAVKPQVFARIFRGSIIDLETQRRTP